MYQRYTQRLQNSLTYRQQTLLLLQLRTQTMQAQLKQNTHSLRPTNRRQRSQNTTIQNTKRRTKQATQQAHRRMLNIKHNTRLIITQKLSIRHRQRITLRMSQRQLPRYDQTTLPHTQQRRKVYTLRSIHVHIQQKRSQRHSTLSNTIRQARRQPTQR